MKTTTYLWSLQPQNSFWEAETSRDLAGSSSQAAAAQSVGENPAGAQSWWTFFFFLQGDSPAATGSRGLRGCTSTLWPPVTGSQAPNTAGRMKNCWATEETSEVLAPAMRQAEERHLNSEWSQGEDGDLRFDQLWQISRIRKRKHIYRRRLQQTLKTREIEGELRVLGERHLKNSQSLEAQRASDW